MDTIHLQIDGMHSSGCAVGIQMLTEQIEGVSYAVVDLDGKRGTWEYDITLVTPELIIEQITKLGYTVTIISANS